jgi:hypothetical protein
MFSRTTMASSISRPTHRLSAISVIMLMVKPNRFMNKKVPISAMGSVSPVMTVERHEFRNKNTISTVSMAPSISVWRTLATATRMGREPSPPRLSLHAGRQLGLQLGQCRFRPSTTSMVFSSCDFLHRQQQRALAVVKRQASTSCAPSSTPGHLTQAHGWRPVLARDDDLAESHRAAPCARQSAPPLLLATSGWRPPGVLVFVAHGRPTWSAVMPKASMACGLR